MHEGYDIIGDIHGHGLELVALLQTLGYDCREGYYRHPTRQAIFLGDFIDRGPNQRMVLDIVMAMVEAGAARAVMGNHELNAIGFHTPHPETPDIWLRARDDKHTRQHLAFLSEYLAPGCEAKLARVLDFFRSLPVFLDLGEIRAIHACWHPDELELIRPGLDASNALLPDRLPLCFGSAPGDEDFTNAIEILLKGMECNLPEGAYYHDTDGNRRDKARCRWWKQDGQTFDEIVMCYGDVNLDLSEIPAPADAVCGYWERDVPVFFGHYQLQGEPRLQAPNIACLDYSVHKVGKLVAYRWSGESVLREDHLVSIEARW